MLALKIIKTDFKVGFCVNDCFSEFQFFSYSNKIVLYYCFRLCSPACYVCVVSQVLRSSASPLCEIFDSALLFVRLQCYVFEINFVFYCFKFCFAFDSFL